MSSHKSPTEKLVAQIEAVTGVILGETQRKELCDMIRKYRFEQVSASMLKLRKLIKDSGNEDLSAHIFASFDP